MSLEHECMQRWLTGDEAVMAMGDWADFDARKARADALEARKARIDDKPLRSVHLPSQKGDVDF